MSTLARSFRHHEALRKWLRLVVNDPTCYAIVNDWLQHNISLLDEVDEFVMLHRSFVRVDCKLDYLYLKVIESIKNQAARHALASSPQDTRSQENPLQPPATEITLSSSSGECYWKQFVAQAGDFDEQVFRLPLRVAISRGENLRLDNLTLVLVRLLSGLLQPTTGLFVRNEADNTLIPSPQRHANDSETLREYFVLGEFIAYLVLSEVCVGEVFEFSTEFLSAVVGRAVQPSPGVDSFTFRVFAESFAAGFDVVLPATLAMLHPEELRMMLNARSYSLNVAAIDWSAVVAWDGFDQPVENGIAEVDREDGEVQDSVIMRYWKRLLSELIEEERVSVVLRLTGSFFRARRLFFGVTDAGTTPQRFRVQRRQATISNADTDPVNVTSSASDDDALMPVLDVQQLTLEIPAYSSYERFRTAMLSVFRRANDVVTPVLRRSR